MIASEVARFLIAGLGNPGLAYTATRHNLGFMVVDHLAKKIGQSFKSYGGNFEYCEGKQLIFDYILMKPQTYMNLSGLAIAAALNCFIIDVKQLLVISDDINLPFGKLRLRARGSDGGHNGLASIISTLQTSNFPRLRIGIGTRFEKAQMVDYVLSPFTSEEQQILPAVIEAATNAITGLMQDGLEKTMSSVNALNFGL